MSTEPGAFANKIAIVTGASSGIGRACALALAASGASVAAAARDAAALEGVAEECVRGGGRAVALATDLTSPSGADDLVSRTVARFGGLDVVVNAAGIIAMGATDTTSDELWERVMDLNVRAPFRVMRAAFPHLKARRGAVVNVSSVNGQRVFPGLAAYNTSKAALDQLTRCAAIEWAPLGIRVNAVCPGVTVTNLHRRSGMSEEAYTAFLTRAKETHPLGRPGKAEEIAALVLFLASDQAGWVTGETVAIDGGRHLTCAR
jgi:NAD(P)-dependent dehydrogenase (short-subunit alcohol dehydrogenase family)